MTGLKILFFEKIGFLRLAKPQNQKFKQPLRVFARVKRVELIVKSTVFERKVGFRDIFLTTGLVKSR